MRIENEMMIDLSLIWLKALIVTDWEETDWEGIPEIIPEVRLRERPSGRDPSMIENERLSPLNEGLIMNNSSFARI